MTHSPWKYIPSYKKRYRLPCDNHVIKVNNRTLTNALSVTQRTKHRKRKVVCLTPDSNCTIFYLYMKLCEIKVRAFYVPLGTFVHYHFFPKSSILNLPHIQKATQICIYIFTDSFLLYEMKKDKLKSEPLPFLHHIDMLLSCCPSDFKVLH